MARTTAKQRAVVALAIALGFYALSDILLWQRIFEANKLWTFDTDYQTGHVDVLHHWLDAKPIPDVLPWLDRSRLIFIRSAGGDVTNLELLASTAFWIGVWMGTLVLLPRIRSIRWRDRLGG
ncbi:MAG: hypothetical protein E6H82_11430 [Chloroflexi bacterium]|nr:MAG: hypothetical protein E6H82_11430 [Chloroflexota bacterium]